MNKVNANDFVLVNPPGSPTDSDDETCEITLASKTNLDAAMAYWDNPTYPPSPFDILTASGTRQETTQSVQPNPSLLRPYDPREEPPPGTYFVFWV